jgi:hypothetical protein
MFVRNEKHERWEYLKFEVYILTFHLDKLSLVQ